MGRKYSASGIALLNSCERAFFYRYNMKALTGNAGVDCDAPKKAAMVAGNLFHDFWEKSISRKITLAEIKKAVQEEKHISINKATRVKTIQNVFNPNEFPAILLAMCVEYKAFLDNFTKKCGLAELCLELGFETDITRGFVDCILYDKDSGQWGIQDKKTRASLQEGSLANMSKTPQFLMYIAHLNEIIKLVEKRTGVKLERNKFLGFYVCEITRPIAARKKKKGIDKEIVETRKESAEHYDTVENTTYSEDCYTESLEEFYGRLISEKKIQVRQGFVPASEFDVTSFWNNQMEPMIRKAVEMERAFGVTNEVQGMCNTDNCVNRYGAPCDYWSQCHSGKTYSESVFEINENSITHNEKEKK